MTDIPRWPKISLLDDPDEEERARQQLNESRRQRGLPPLYPESGFPPPLPVFGGIVPGKDKLIDPREIDPGFHRKPEDTDPREVDPGFYRKPGGFNFVEGEPGASAGGDQVAQAEPPPSPPPAAEQKPENAPPDSNAQGQAFAEGKPTQPGKPLTYDQIRELVRENNNSKLPDEMIVAIIFKESSFDPSARGNTRENPALGLMQIQKRALIDAHDRLPKNEQYAHEHVLDPAVNIRLGSTYLQQQIDLRGGDVSKGLFHYGPRTPDYVPQVLAATEALKQNPKNPISALSRIYGRKYP